MLQLKILKTSVSVTSLITHLLVLIIFTFVYLYGLNENDIDYNTSDLIDKNNIQNNHNFTNVAYFTLVTHSTLGYGDIKPITPKAKRIISLHVFIIIVLVAFFGSN